MSLWRAITMTAIAWGVAFLCTWVLVLEFGSGAIR